MENFKLEDKKGESIIQDLTPKEVEKFKQAFSGEQEGKDSDDSLISELTEEEKKEFKKNF